MWIHTSQIFTIEDLASANLLQNPNVFQADLDAEVTLAFPDHIIYNYRLDQSKQTRIDGGGRLVTLSSDARVKSDLYGPKLLSPLPPSLMRSPQGHLAAVILLEGVITELWVHEKNMADLLLLQGLSSSFPDT